MTSDNTGDSFDRRQFIGGCATVAGLALAGCMGQSGGTNEQNDKSTHNGSSSTGTGEKTRTTADEKKQTQKQKTPYTVSMVPVGDVTFEEVPKRWVAGNGSWGDMGVALGVGAPKGVWLPSRYPTYHYEKLPGVSIDTDNITQMYSDGVDKEIFYELAADVHVMDPNFIINRFKWKQSDIKTIKTNVAPFFGNTIFSRAYPWHDYRYYTLYEAFGKLAKVFQRQDRYKAFSALHDEFITNVKSKLPPKRPSVAILWPASKKLEAFYPYQIDKGTTYKQWRDLGVKDAIANSEIGSFHETRGTIGYEALLDIDPDVLLLQGNEEKSPKEFQKTVVSVMKNHPLASNLRAVQNGNVFRGGGLYQGPIINLFLTERGAQQLYPDVFTKNEMFDRQRVADIVNGKL